MLLISISGSVLSARSASARRDSKSGSESGGEGLPQTNDAICCIAARFYIYVRFAIKTKSPLR